MGHVRDVCFCMGCALMVVLYIFLLPTLSAYWTAIQCIIFHETWSSSHVPIIKLFSHVCIGSSVGGQGAGGAGSPSAGYQHGWGNAGWQGSHDQIPQSHYFRARCVQGRVGLTLHQVCCVPDVSHTQGLTLHMYLWSWWSISFLYIHVNCLRSIFEFVHVMYHIR